MMTILLLLGCVLAISANSQVYSETLDEFCASTSRGTECFYLHHSAEGVTWFQAQGECTKRDTSLAAVLDDTVQNELQDKFQNVIPGEHLWIGGQETGSTKWIWLDGTRFKDDLKSDGDQYRCGVALKQEALLYSAKVESRLCTNNMESVICTSGIPTACKNTSTRQATRFMVNSISYCFYKTSSVYTWYQARTFCNNRGETLASFSYYNQSYDFRAEYLSNLTPLLTSSGSWIGLHATRWKWMSAAPVYPEAYEEPATVAYTSWRDEENNDVNQRCIYMDFENNGNWADENCSKVLYYYICQNTLAPTTHTETHTTRTTTIATQSGIPKGMGTVTSPKTNRGTDITTPMSWNSTRNKETIIIAVVVSIMAILLLIIVVLVILVRRRSRREARATSKRADSTEPIKETLPTGNHDFYNTMGDKTEARSEACPAYAGFIVSQGTEDDPAGRPQATDRPCINLKKLPPPPLAKDGRLSRALRRLRKKGPRQDGAPEASTLSNVTTISDTEFSNDANKIPLHKAAPGTGDLYTEVFRDTVK